MKRIATVLASLFVAVMCFMSQAEIVTPEVAKIAAENILSLDDEWRGEGETTITLVEQDGIAAYYVIEYSEGGWIVVSAQSSSDPLIAYNHTG